MRVAAGFFRSLSLLSLIFLCAVALAHADDPPAEGSTQVVAEVNARKITKQQLMENLRRQLKNQLPYFSEAEQHTLAKEMLDRMIERELLLQAAERQKLVPTEEEAKQFIAKLKGALPDKEMFQKELSKNGVSESTFSAGMREDLAIKNYLDKNVFQGLSLKPDEVNRAYLESPQSFAEPEEVRVRQILFKVKDGALPAEVEAIRVKAETVRTEAVAPGTDFGAMARKYSQAPDAGKGGDLGFFTKNQLDTSFTDAAFALQPGQISPLVKTKLGFHIIKLEERRGGTVPPLPEIRDKVEASLLRNSRQSRLSDHLKKLRKEGRVLVYFH